MPAPLPNVCPSCGARIDESGECLRCLLRLGLSDGNQEGPGADTGVERIGPYRLISQLGEGGCGVVYRAEQIEPIRRKVALKIIKLGMDTKSVISRFEIEKQALAMMDHPNVAKVFDAGTTENGRPYFAMELVDGDKITDYCDSKKLSTAKRLELFIAVCQAVQHAHQKGIIHRDIKPSNILVAEDDAGVPVPKVIDFGIAKATADQQLADHTCFTAFEQFIGTPAYMSPEQAQFSGVDIDTRSDIYALGVLLYELLTGETPFPAGELLQAGLDELRKIIREREPVRPSTRLNTMQGRKLTTVATHRVVEAQRLISQIRGDLDWIVMRCLEKDRTRRYESASDLASDIQRHLNNDAVVARPPSTTYRLQKLVRRNRPLFVAGSLAVFALIAGLIVSSWGLLKARENEAKMVAEAAETREIARFLKDMLKSVGPSVAQGRDTTMLREILDKTAGHVSRDLHDRPEVEAELSFTIADVYFDLNDFEKAERMYRRSSELREQIFGTNSLPVAQSKSHLARVFPPFAKWSQAEKLLRESLATHRALQSTNVADLLFTVKELSVALRPQGKSSRREAELILRSALGTARQTFGDSSPEYADVLEHLAKVLRLEQKFAEMEQVSNEALAIRRKFTDDQIALSRSLRFLAEALRSEAKYGEAEPLAREALQMDRKLYPTNSPALAESVENLGKILYYRNRPTEAEPLLREATNIRQSAGLYDVTTASMLQVLAYALLDAHKTNEADCVLNNAINLWRKVDPITPELAGTLYTKSLLLYDQGKLAEAESMLRQALAIRKHFTGAEAQAPDSLFVLGKILWSQKRFAEAVSTLEQSVDAGGTDACQFLAVSYKRGIGVPLDAVKSTQWFARYRQELRKHADLGSNFYIQRLAWLLATCPDDSVRDGHEALVWANKAATDRRTAESVDTLAAAHAECSDFSAAAALENEAIGVQTDPLHKSEYRLRLQLYQSHAPFRADYPNWP